MNNKNPNVGMEVLFLLRQQRYLYHQLKSLTFRQQQLAGNQSPELILEIIAGRRKLTEKLQQLENQLRPIRTNWEKVSERISPEDIANVKKVTSEVQEIVLQIQEIAPTEAIGHLPLDGNLQLTGTGIQTQAQWKD